MTTTTQRRARKGDGSIRQRGDRFQARRANATTGRYETKTFGAEQAARDWLRERAVDSARGVGGDPAAGGRRVESWWPVLQADAERRLKPSTRKYYRELWTQHIEPRWGKAKVSTVTAARLHVWVAELADQGVAASRVKGAYGLLSRLLDQAVLDGAITVNPAQQAKPRMPRQAPAERPVLEVSEVGELVKHAHVVKAEGRDLGSPALAVLVQTLAWTGLRIGEALALHREDIDLTAGTVSVRRSVADIDGHLVVGSTKTHETRVVTMPAAVVKTLRGHLKNVPIGPKAVVFGSRSGGYRRYSNFRRDAWVPMLRRYNAARELRGLEPVSVMPHDLRSSCASLLIDAGASPKDVQAHLGHADISTTLNLYARVRPGRAVALASRMDDLLQAGTVLP